jgi:hypothetical protein
MLAGSSSTIATHHPAEATIARPPMTVCQMRRSSGGRAAIEVGQREAGHDEEGLQGLGEEGQADEDTDESEPARRGLLDRADRGPRSQCHGEDKQRIGVVEAEHQHRDGCQREDRTRDQACGGTELALHRGIDDADRRDAHEHLGQQDRERVEPEDPHRQGHEPQRGRRLVDGDRVRRV